MPTCLKRYSPITQLVTQLAQMVAQKLLLAKPRQLKMHIAATLEISSQSLAALHWSVVFLGLIADILPLTAIVEQIVTSREVWDSLTRDAQPMPTAPAMALANWYENTESNYKILHIIVFLPSKHSCNRAKSEISVFNLSDFRASFRV